MAEPPNPARGPVAVLSEKEAFGKPQPSSRESPGSMSAKKVRTEEKKAPRRVNGEGASGGNGGQLQPPAAPSPQSYGSPAAWSFAARPAASSPATSSPATSRSCYSFSASPSVSSASASSSQPLPRKLLVASSLLHVQPHRVLLPPVTPSAAAKPRRPKEKREKEKRRHGLGGAARDENGKAKPLPRGGCRAGEGSGGRGGQHAGSGRQPARGGQAAACRGARSQWSLEFRSPTGGMAETPGLRCRIRLAENAQQDVKEWV